MEHQEFDNHLLEIHRPDPDLPPRMDVWPTSDIDIPLDTPLQNANVEEGESHLTSGENEWGEATPMDLEILLDDVERELDWEMSCLEAVESRSASKWPSLSSPARTSHRSYRCKIAITSG
jgi:hypothetical protein